MDKADLILLAVAAVLAIAVIAYSLSGPKFFREISKGLCEDSDGVWNECGSLCTGEPSGTLCADVCVPLCECLSDIQCPPGYYCQISGIAQNETGACRPFLSDFCEYDEDCPQPRCPGVHSVCQGGECRVVNEQGALARC